MEILFLVLIAPLVGMFFSTPQATPIVRGVAVGFLLQGAINPALILLERDLAFARGQAPIVAGVLADVVSTIVIGTFTRSVWALVIGFILGRVVVLIASFLVKPRRPKLEIRTDRLKEHYRYGRHITRAFALEFVAGQIDRVMVGRLLGPMQLGLYAFGSRMANLPGTAVYKIVYGVAFPVFTRVQDGAVLLDPRTLLPGDEEDLLAGFVSVAR